MSLETAACYAVGGGLIKGYTPYILHVVQETKQQMLNVVNQCQINSGNSPQPTPRCDYLPPNETSVSRWSSCYCKPHYVAPHFTYEEKYVGSDLQAFHSCSHHPLQSLLLVRCKILCHSWIHFLPRGFQFYAELH